MSAIGRPGTAGRRSSWKRPGRRFWMRLGISSSTGWRRTADPRRRKNEHGKAPGGQHRLALFLKIYGKDLSLRNIRDFHATFYNQTQPEAAGGSLKQRFHLLHWHQSLKKFMHEKSCKKARKTLTICTFHGILIKLTSSPEGTRRCSTMVRAPAFQAGDASSILVTCSTSICASSSAG